MLSAFAALLSLVLSHRLDLIEHGKALLACLHRTLPPSLPIRKLLLHPLLRPWPLSDALVLRLNQLRVIDDGTAEAGLGHVRASR